MTVMGALELRDELQEFIEIGDTKFIALLHKTAKEYIERKKRDRMIEEGEADIAAGRIHSQQEIKDQIKNWTA